MLGLLFSTEFIDYWRWDHIELAIITALEYSNFDGLATIFKSTVCKGLFSCQKVKERFLFIETLVKEPSLPPKIRQELLLNKKCLHESPYNTYYFLLLLNREIYKKLDNYADIEYLTQEICVYELNLLVK